MRAPTKGVVLIWNNIVPYRLNITYHLTPNLAIYQRAMSRIMLTFCFGKKRRPLARAQQDPENVGNKSVMLRGVHPSIYLGLMLSHRVLNANLFACYDKGPSRAYSELHKDLGVRGHPASGVGSAFDARKR